MTFKEKKQAIYLVSIAALLVFSACGESDGSKTGETGETANSSLAQYTVGGAIEGLAGSLILQNNRVDDLVVDSNGSFKFSNSLADGKEFNVVIRELPSNQSCAIENGTGSVNGSDVSDIRVTCTSSFIIKSGPPVPVRASRADSSGQVLVIVEYNEDLKILPTAIGCGAFGMVFPISSDRLQPFFVTGLGDCGEVKLSGAMDMDDNVQAQPITLNVEE